MNAHHVATWDAPEGFFVFRTSWDDESWVREVVERLAPADERTKRLTQQLEDFVILSRLDPDEVIHVAGTGAGRWGSPELFCTGRIATGPLVDLDEVAASWEADLAAPVAVEPVVVPSPGRRAPGVSARVVYRHRGRDGVERYRERGVALVNHRSHACSVKAEFTTWDMSPFDDIGAFALESARALTLEEVRSVDA